MYENKNNWARKVGFGFRPDDEVPSNIDVWNSNQLDGKFQLFGLNKVGLWPEEHNFSIEQRLNRLHKHHRYIEKTKKESTYLCSIFFYREFRCE